MYYLRICVPTSVYALIFNKIITIMRENEVKDDSEHLSVRHARPFYKYIQLWKITKIYFGMHVVYCVDETKHFT